ncbi:MAG: thiamine pyrophosphate-dependent dehydrogenase E1 component subunit alpha [Bacteroidetes bacterium]|nr:thiamine pyrophosphate-dependent dehydrogenase E1 component subunit alpha [Bacteroidota bacterium]
MNSNKPLDLSAKVPPIKPSKLLSNSRRIEMFTYMLQAREFDLAMQRLNRQGRAFGGVYSQTGNEASSVGSAYALGDKDVLFPMHRNIGGHFVFKQDLNTLMLAFLAREGSLMRGTDGTGHYADVKKRIYGNVSHLGAMIPVAAGFVLASKMRGESVVSMTYIGDGGAQTGEFHEGVNFASVQKLPLILIIENNQYAYSSPNSVEFACVKLSDRALGYGCFGVTIDGTDVELVYETCFKAAERARKGEGPSLIESITMRMRGHAEHDDFSYVSREELEYWKKRDPIDRYQKYLLTKKVLSLDEITSIRTKLIDDIRSAIDYAVDLPFPSGEEGFKNVFID